MLLGFFAGSLAFGRVSEDRFRSPDSGDHPGRRSLSPLEQLGLDEHFMSEFRGILWPQLPIIETLNYTHTYPYRVQVTDIAIAINPL